MAGVRLKPDTLMRELLQPLLRMPRINLDVNFIQSRKTARVNGRKSPENFEIVSGVNLL